MFPCLIYLGIFLVVCFLFLVGLRYLLLVELEIKAKAPMDTKLGTYVQGVPCALPFVENVGAPLMTTLNFTKITMGL